MPIIHVILESCFELQCSVLQDLQSGYWQVMMDESSKARAAVATPFGLYQFQPMASRLSLSSLGMLCQQRGLKFTQK